MFLDGVCRGRRGAAGDLIWLHSAGGAFGSDGRGKRLGGSGNRCLCCSEQQPQRGTSPAGTWASASHVHRISELPFPRSSAVSRASQPARQHSGLERLSFFLSPRSSRTQPFADRAAGGAATGCRFRQQTTQKPKKQSTNPHQDPNQRNPSHPPETHPHLPPHSQ